MLSEGVKGFFKTNIFANKISTVGRQEIEECITNANPLKTVDISETIKKINTGKPVLLMGGPEGHAISILIRGNELFVCNRGYGRSSNDIISERFLLLPPGVDKKMLENLMYRKYKNDNDFNNIIMEMIKQSKLKPAGGVRQKLQKVGNCALASSKAAVGILFLLYSDYKDWDDYNGSRKMSVIGNTVYKQFTADLRIIEVKKYLREHLKTPPGNTQIAYDMLGKIIGKCPEYKLNKIIESLKEEFPQKIEEIYQIFAAAKAA